MRQLIRSIIEYPMSALWYILIMTLLQEFLYLNVGLDSIFPLIETYTEYGIVGWTLQLAYYILFGYVVVRSNN